VGYYLHYLRKRARIDRKHARPHENGQGYFDSIKLPDAGVKART